MQALTIPELRQAYLDKTITPQQVIDDCLTRIAEDKESNAWICVLTEQQLKSYLDELEHKAIESHPLWGIPFAIKDNIDLAGCPTTAGCPTYSYTPQQHAFVVARLIAAGAIPLGKTNMDQFATGLVGTRSPYGAVPCVYDKNYISGGSSSGSAYAVATGQVAFSLGTDTAGSGRVPAAFNGLIGVKPTRGLISCSGVVPACKSLDCVSLFCHDLQDANALLEVTAVLDEQDSYGRQREFYGISDRPFKIGIPTPEQCYFLNDEYRCLFESAANKFTGKGMELVEVDFSPFTAAAKLLYQGPWVAERYHAVGEFIEEHITEVDESVATIIRGAKAITGKRAFDGFYQLQALQRETAKIMAQVDAMLIPTAPTQFTMAEIAENPILNNTELGYYTNFMNLLDYAALAIPAGTTLNKLAFGITLFGPAQSDVLLQNIAAQVLEQPLVVNPRQIQPEKIPVAVCGAHLQGMPLNWQLTDRHATLLNSTTTAPCYEFYALAGGPPYRPGVKRVAEGGQAIAVEVWQMPAKYFGSFVAGIPAPLGIGKVELADGSWVPGFICEPYGLDDAEDITALGNWRRYIETLS